MHLGKSVFEGGAVCWDTQIMQRGSGGGCALLSLPAANDDGGGYFSFVIMFLFFFVHDFKLWI